VFSLRAESVLQLSVLVIGSIALKKFQKMTSEPKNTKLTG
jgi:hypothetical protein